MPKRRGHDEGSIFQRHTPDCPPRDPETRERPKHACKGRWVCEVDLGTMNGQRVRKTIYGRTRKEVAIKLQEAQASKRSGTLTIGRTTVKAWMDHWIDVVCVEKKRKPNTLRTYRVKTDTHITPYLGDMRLDRLQVDHIRAWLATLERKGVSETMRAAVFTILRTALNAAVKERRIPYNPAALIDGPKQPDHPRDPLSLAQAKAVLKAAGDNPRWFLALYLALRQGEVLALRWRDVDLEAAELHVEQTLGIATDRSLVIDTPKSAKSRTTLPLPTVIGSRLAVLRARVDPQPDDLVFGRPDGSPMHPRTDWGHWKDLLQTAGLPHVAPHCARNTTATLLKELGVSIEDVRAILRHAKIDMTDHYQADVLSRKRDTLSALEGALALEE